MDATRMIIELLFVIAMSIFVICCVFAWHLRQRGATLPVTAQRSRRLIRAGELSVLTLLADAVWYRVLWSSQYNGEILIFSEVSLPIVRSAHLSMFAATLSIGIVGLLIGACLRVSAAIPIVILTGATFSTINAHSGVWVPTLAGFDPDSPPIPIEFKLDDGVEQADLWVNGVRLGKTPFNITLDELIQRVPDWKLEPDLDQIANLPIGYPEKFGPSHRYRRIRATFSIWSPTKPAVQKHFIMAVARNGEPGTPHSGHVNQTGGSSYQGILTAAIVNLKVTFPSQLAAIEEQLDLVRLLDYEPGAAWFVKMESFGDTAWLKLRHASWTEPELDSVMDAWARQTYKIDRATDGPAAFAILKKILADRVEAGSYFTQSLAGRAVRLLAPKLDPDLLVDQAVSTFGDNSRVPMGIWGSGSDNTIGSEMPRNRDVYNSQNSGTGTVAEQVLITDAVMLLDFHLDIVDRDSDNAIEDRLVPWLLTVNQNRDNWLEDAVFLGGSHVDKFLLRQNWQKQPTEFFDPLNVRLGAHDVLVNRWLLTLANHDSHAAARIRRKHRSEFVKLATRILQARNGFFQINLNSDVDFIFLHGNQPGSLAEEFWPVFNGLVESVKDPGERLRLRYRYLARIHPLSTPEQFCKLYEYMPQRRIHDPLQGLYLIPDAQRKSLLKALLKRNQELIDEVDSPQNGTRKQLLNSDRIDLERMIEELDPVAKSVRIAKVVEQHNEERRTSYREYLINAQPDVRVIPLLAKSEIPEIRELAVVAARYHPTAELRAILETLTEDADQKVRTAAVTASNELEALLSAASGN